MSEHNNWYSSTDARQRAEHSIEHAADSSYEEAAQMWATIYVGDQLKRIADFLEMSTDGAGNFQVATKPGF